MQCVSQAISVCLFSAESRAVLVSLSQSVSVSVNLYKSSLSPLLCSVILGLRLHEPEDRSSCKGPSSLQPIDGISDECLQQEPRSSVILTVPHFEI